MNISFTSFLKQRRDQLDATISDLLVINCSSTCFGRLYAHHQEVRLRFIAYGLLSCKRISVWSVLLWRVELYCIIVMCVYKVDPSWSC